jgi:ABC-type glycerol-3-phosphate transport system substrate-binding protein
MSARLSAVHLTRRSALLMAGATLFSPAILRKAYAQSDEWPLEGTDLTIMIWDGGALVDNTILKLQQAWSAKGGGTLRVRKVPYGDLDRAIRAANQGNARPDIMMGATPNVITYASLGLIAPLDDMFTPEDLADFFPVPRESSLIDGSFYGPSTNENGQVLVYDKNVVDKYGFDLPQTTAEGWTWDRALEVFMEIQRAERAARGVDNVWATLLGQNAFTLYSSGVLPRSNGAPGSPTFRLISEDGRTVDGHWNATETLEALEFARRLHAIDGISPTAELNDLFWNGNVIFWQVTPFNIGSIEQIAPQINLGTTTVPFMRTPIVHTGAFNWMVNAGAPNLEEAKHFARFCGSVEGNDIVSREFVSPPIRRSMIADRAEFASGPLALFIDALENWSQPYPRTRGASEYEVSWNRLYDGVLAGGNIEAIVDQEVLQLDRQLSRYYR